MSTPIKNIDKSAADSRRPAVGVVYNKVNQQSSKEFSRVGYQLKAPPNSPLGFGKINGNNKSHINLPIMESLVDFPPLKKEPKVEPPKKKQKFSNKKYIASPVRNANKVQRERDIDIRIARDLKFDFQSGLFETIRNASSAVNYMGEVDMGKVNHILDLFSDIDKDYMSDTFSEIRSGAISINEVAALINSSITTAENRFESYADGMETLVFYSSILVGSAYFIDSCKSRDPKSRAIVCVCIVVMVISAPKDIKDYWKDIFTSVAAWFMPYHQDATLPLGSIATLLGLTLSAITARGSRQDFVSKFSDALVNLDKKINSISLLVKFFLDTSVSCLNSVLERCGFNKFYIHDSSGNFVAQEFVNEYNRMVALIDDKKFDYNESNFRLVLSLCDQSQKILIDLRKDPSNDGLLRIITTIHNKLLARKELFLSSNFNLSGIRMEPVCVLLKGKPGVGKSQMVLFLHAAICAFALEGEIREQAKQDSSKFMFNRQPENVYWDGYDAKHITTVFDDFGQIRDVAGNPDCEYMNIIRAVNEFPAMLHTAAMEKKANTFFRSEFVIATTNMGQFRPESIICPDALFRRFHLCYEVEVLPEFATSKGRIDISKLEKDRDGNPIYDPNIVQFVEYDYSTNSRVGKPLKFFDFVDIVRHTWLEHRRRNAVKVNNIEDVMKRVQAKYDHDAEYQIGFSTIFKDFLEYIDPRSYDEVQWDARLVVPMENIEFIEELESIHVDFNSEGFAWIYDWVKFSDIEKHLAFEDYFQRIFCKHYDLTKIRGLKNSASYVRVYDCFAKAHGIPNWRAKFVRYPHAFMNLIHTGIENGLFKEEKLTPEVFFKKESYIDFTKRSMGVVKEKWDRYFFPRIYRFLNSTPVTMIIVSAIVITVPTLISPWIAANTGAARKARAKAAKIHRDKITAELEKEMEERIKRGYKPSSCLPQISIFPSQDAKEEAPKYTWDTFECFQQKWKDQNGVLFEIMVKGDDVDMTIIREVLKRYDDRIAKLGLPLNPDDEGTIEDDVHPSQQTYTMKKSTGKKGKIQKKDFKKLQEELRAEAQSYFGADINGTRIVDKVVSRNLYRIYFVNDATQELMGYGLFLRGTSMLMPQHFAYQVARFLAEGEVDDCVIKFDLASKGETNPAHSFILSLKDFVVSAETELFSGRDLSIIRLPKHVSMHQDIVGYFLGEADYKRIMDWNVRLIIAREGAHESITSAAYPLTQPLCVAGTDTLEPYTITKGFKMIGLTTAGDCGSPLVVINSRLPKGRFMGLHTAGIVTRGVGITCTVTKEELEAYFEGSPDIIESFEPEEYDTFEPTQAQSQFKPLYKAPLKHNSGNKTMIARSDIYGYNGEVLTAPSVLRPVYRMIDGERTLVDPYIISIRKYCTPYIRFNCSDVDLAKTSVYEMLRRTSSKFDSTILSFDVAVLGDPNDEFFGSISRSTSAGYPYCSMNMGRGKYAFFGSGQDFDLNNELALKLRREVEDIIFSAMNGIRKEHIFTDNLKDERRTLEKIENVKTRLFSGAPLSYTIVFRMYFGKFMSWYIRNNINNGSAIGLNVFGLDWDLLSKKMTEKGSPDEPFCGAGDFSGFDGSEKPNIHWAILDLINLFYDDGKVNCKIREILWYDLVNSKHIRGDLVFSWPSSLPSGHPCTTITNNLYNHIAFNLCWIDLGLPIFGADSFYEKVYLCTMGDDNIYAVHPAFRSVFTELRISKSMAKLGLTYTPEDKTGDFQDSLRSLTSISFLKRSFRWDRELSIWVAPIEMNVILDIPNWTKTNADMRTQITVDNVEVALMELSLHGREVFAKYAPCMLSAYEQAHLPPLKYTTFDANCHAIHNRLRYL